MRKTRTNAMLSALCLTASLLASTASIPLTAIAEEEWTESTATDSTETESTEETQTTDTTELTDMTDATVLPETEPVLTGTPYKDPEPEEPLPENVFVNEEPIAEETPDEETPVTEQEQLTDTTQPPVIETAAETRTAPAPVQTEPATTVTMPAAAEPVVYVQPDSTADTGFTKYQLTETELIKLASLCQAEQGTALGAAAEASLIANRYELYGGRYASIYDYARYCRWFAHAGAHMDRMNAYSDVIAAVKSVLVDGKRTLPAYIDEHDCFSDIWRSTNNGKAIRVSDRSSYIRDVTKCANVYTGYWTFYTFADAHSDPFGYTSPYLAETMDDSFYDLSSGKKLHNGDLGYPMGRNPYGQVLPDGDYRICATSDKGLSLKNDGTGNAAFLKDATDTVWTVIYNKDTGFYTVKLRDTDLCLTVENSDYIRCANVHLLAANNTTAQEWALKPEGSGYTLQSRCNSFYLNADTIQLTNGETMTISRNANTDAKTEKTCTTMDLIPVSGDKTMERENYYISYDNCYLSLTGLQPSIPNDLSAAKHAVKLVYLENGWYSLQDAETGKALTAPNTLNGNVQLTPFSNEKNQRWLIRKVNDHYAIISEDSGYCLSKKLTMISYGSDAEKWDFAPVRATDLTIETLPSKLEYNKDEPLDLTGIKVVATLENGIKEDVTHLITSKGDTSSDGDISILFDGFVRSFPITIRNTEITKTAEIKTETPVVTLSEKKTNAIQRDKLKNA